MWDEKFSGENFLYGKEPNKFVKNESYRIAPNSKILCLAEGEGRNGVFLASCGHSVTCLDLSSVGLQKAAKLAQENGVVIATVHDDIFKYSTTDKFDTVICTFLHLEYARLKLFCEKIHNILNQSGCFIGQFFTKDQLNKTSGGPKDIELLYDPKMLERVFKSSGFEILYFVSKDEELDEGEGHKGIASLVSIVAKKKEVI